MGEHYTDNWPADADGIRMEPVEKQAGGRTGVLTEIGSTGLRRHGGRIYEEFLRDLQGRDSVEVFKEMSDNDPVVGAILNTVDKMLRQVTWTVEGADDTVEESKKDQLFLQENLDDMSQPWRETISNTLSFLPHGWNFSEVVYKKRLGENQPGAKRSKFTDGLFGWRKFSGRAQETLDEWGFDESGGITGMHQQDPYADKPTRVFIPIERSLLFRTTTEKNNPEGKSILRNAYRPWFIKRRIEDMLGIGVERDLTGIPLAKVPARYLGNLASPDEQVTVTYIKRMLRDLRRHEQAGVLWPSEFDDKGNDQFSFGMVQSPGTRQFDIVAVLNYLDSRIAATNLADFILLGHEKVGSFALGSAKTALFSYALGSYLDIIADTINRHAVPRLFRLNGWQRPAYPKVRHGDVEQVDLTELATIINAAVGSGVITVDNELENHLRRMIGWPLLGDEAAE